MTRPDDIPQWAWDEALEVISDCTIDDGTVYHHSQFQARIARALIAVEQRAYKDAAKVADDVARDFAAYRDHYPQRDGAKSVARAIRAKASQKGERE